MSTQDSAGTGKIISDLTAERISPDRCRYALRQFAAQNGWRPSDEMVEYRGTEDTANGHLVVEHGLSNSAVITFLKRNHRFSLLSGSEKIRLLSMSYNNMVDWHFFPDTGGMTVVYNRTDPPDTKHASIDEEKDAWRAEAFERIVGRRPNPNIGSLDDVLIDTISYWKRALASELKRSASNDSAAALFNAILLVRAYEDQLRAQGRDVNRALVATWEDGRRSKGKVRTCLKSCLRSLGVKAPPVQLLDEAKLRVFDRLDKETVRRLLEAFYRHQHVPYEYDFSIMSKHALSRIYERYVSLLQEKRSPQKSLFPELPDEVTGRGTGSVYTPEYIPRFFARYLKEMHSPPAFRSLRTIDPACGSGIFLRTILEMQCDPLQPVDMRGPTRTTFRNVLGLDVDPNACQATRLSLSLLHLVLTDKFPKDLHILTEEMIRFYRRNQGLRQGFDVVMTNPPFVKWDRLDSTIQARIGDVMAEHRKGKPDLCLAFLKLGMEMVKPGGYLLYVLPHSFLIAHNARSLREMIGAGFWVRLLADLSEVPVFGDVGSYVILLILQKKADNLPDMPAATIVRCKEFIGLALQDVVEGRFRSTDFYSVYRMDQSNFSESGWHLLSPPQLSLKNRLMRLQRVEDYLTVREGFVTGADQVFIRSARDVPSGESEVYRPYLSDREMQRYAVPSSPEQVVFYPYVGKQKIASENELRERFPITWAYLTHNAVRLKGRTAVAERGIPWWSPTRPRPPENMMRPKIISPHLIVCPRFSLDGGGSYAVSHSPLLYPKQSGDESDLLRYFLAILNSSVSYWQIAQSSHKYSKGYFMLEPKTLRGIWVPDPTSVHVRTMRRLQSSVSECMADPGNPDMHNELDHLVAELYGLGEEELREVGMAD